MPQVYDVDTFTFPKYAKCVSKRIAIKFVGGKMAISRLLFRAVGFIRFCALCCASCTVGLAAHALPITVDPGDYLGPYTVSQHSNLIGVQTVDLQPGSRFIVFPSTSSFSFDVDAVGNVSNLTSPSSATISGSTITLNTVQIHVDPAAYTGQLRIFPSSLTVNTGVQSEYVVRGIHDWAVVFPSTSNIRFDVDAAGIINNIRRVGAATTDGATITLNTAQVNVDPGDYTGPYRIAPSQTVDGAGPQTATIVRDVTDWQVQFRSTGNMRFDVDTNGVISNIRRSGSGTTDGSTIMLNTADITVDPTTFGGLYRIAPSQTSFGSGIQTATVVKDVIQWQVITNAQALFRFDVNPNGDPTPSTVPLIVQGTVHDFNLFQDFGNPIANAGADQSIDEGDIVTLDGTGSTDPQDDPLTYAWNQLAGLPVTLTDSQAVQPNFTAPSVSANETLTLQLIVSDGSSASDPDTVDITIKNANNPPIADADDDATIKAGASTNLNGSGSFDPDGDTITYRWEQVAGAIVSLSDPAVQNPSFEAPLNAGLDLIFKLVVSDGFESSTPSPGTDSNEADTIKISVVANSPPVADAGPDQARGENTLVSLNGSASNDLDGDGLIFWWTQISGPAITLSDAANPSPTFTAPAVSGAGEQIEFELSVTDDDPFNPLSAVDAVIINLVNVNDPPSCMLAEPSKTELWPPNHKLITVHIQGVEDPESGTAGVTLTIESVTQDEPVDGTGDGDTSPDAIIQSSVSGVDEVLVRSERDGGANGRVYEVSFTASDGQETCQGSVQIGVPKKRKNAATDDGQSYDSLGVP